MENEKETRTLFGVHTPEMAQLADKIKEVMTRSSLPPEEKMALMMKQCILLFRLMKTDAAEMKVVDGRVLKLTLEKISANFH